MGTRQKPSGRWQARATIDGRAYSATFDTAEEADEWLMLLRARSVVGAIPSTVRVRDYAARWLDTYEASPHNTREFYRHALRPVLAQLGAARVGRVTPTDVTRVLNRIAADHGVAAADRSYRCLSALFGAAAADGLCDRSPVRARRHRPRRQSAPHQVLERADARAVLMQLGGWHRDTAILQISLGARFGEIAGLTPHDVDLVTGRVSIQRRYSRSGDTIRATKNHRHRVLDLPRTARPTVERLVRLAAPAPPIPALDDREWPARPYDRQWLIQTSTGRPPELSAYNRALAEACAAAGAPRMTSHGLRHTYVSWMLDDGHSADQVAFWIGDVPATVQKVYAHMLEAGSAPAAASIDAALDGLA